MLRVDLLSMKQSHAERVAEEVRAAVARKRTTQGELAAALGLSQAAVSRRLVGLVPFDVSEIYVVAGVLGVPVSSLMPAADGEPVRSAS